jgi:hypothetical protein
MLIVCDKKKVAAKVDRDRSDFGEKVPEDSGLRLSYLM